MELGLMVRNKDARRVKTDKKQLSRRGQFWVWAPYTMIVITPNSFIVIIIQVCHE